MTVSWLQLLIAIAGGLLLTWVVMVVAIYVLGRRHDDPARTRDALRLIPDVVRLVRRLLSDRTVPTGVRVRVGLLALYLLSPIDLVPDVIPVVGYADDVILVALTLRSVTRRAGVEAIDRHWPGTDEGLRALKRLARI
jgi:uncharacterized membrane protein YkvA (DUF1232 family)